MSGICKCVWEGGGLFNCPGDIPCPPGRQPDPDAERRLHERQEVVGGNGPGVRHRVRGGPAGGGGAEVPARKTEGSTPSPVTCASSKHPPRCLCKGGRREVVVSAFEGKRLKLSD